MPGTLHLDSRRLGLQKTWGHSRTLEGTRDLQTTQDLEKARECSRKLFKETLRECRLGPLTKLSSLSDSSALKLTADGTFVRTANQYAVTGGYVGTGIGQISLYKGYEVVKRNLPSDKAVDALIDLIKENGDWVELDG